MKTEPIEVKLTVGNHSYQYYDLGDGPITLVFLHGLAGAKDCMVGLSRDFVKKYRCLYIDLPGHGGIDGEGYGTLASLSTYVYEFITAMKLANPVLVGFSFGGLVALETGKLFMSKGFPVPIVLWASPVNTGESSLSNAARMCMLGLCYVPTHLYQWLLKQEVFFRLLHYFGVKLSVSDSSVLKSYETRYTRSALDMFSRKQDLAVKFPLLIVYGDKDVFIREGSFEKIVGVGKVMIENDGHFGNFEGWDRAVVEIDKFIGQNYA